MTLGALVCGIAFFVVRISDNTYSSTVVTVNNVTVPDKYCGVCGTNYCCAVSTSANLTTGSRVRMWYKPTTAHLEIVALLKQPYYSGKDLGFGCLFTAAALMVIMAVTAVHVSDPRDICGSH